MTGPSNTLLTPQRGNEGYRNLVRLVARALYSGACPPKPPQPPDGSESKLRNRLQKSDNTGLAVVVLDLLCQEEWVREDALATRLQLHIKQLRRVLQYCEEHQLLVRGYLRHKGERSAGTEAGGGDGAGPSQPEEEGQKPKAMTYTYCALDFAGVYNAMQLRLHKLKKHLKEQVHNKEDLQGYVCPNDRCNARYTSLDAVHLMDMTTGTFKCENCRTELRQTYGDGQTGDDMTRRQHVAVKRDMLSRLEAQFKPIVQQLAMLKDVDPPFFGELLHWSNEQKKKAEMVRRLGRGGKYMLDEQGIPMFKIAFDDGSSEAKAQAPVAPKAAVPWMQRSAATGVPGVTAADVKTDGATDDKKNEKDVKGAAEQEAWAQQFLAMVQAQQRGILQEQQQEEPQPKRRRMHTDASTGGTEADLALPAAAAMHGSIALNGAQRRTENETDDFDLAWEEAASETRPQGTASVQQTLASFGAALQHTAHPGGVGIASGVPRGGLLAQLEEDDVPMVQQQVPVLQQQQPYGSAAGVAVDVGAGDAVDDEFDWEDA